MEEEKNINEEILNLKKEIDELKNENKGLNQKINEQSIEIKNLKTEYNQDITKIKKEMENNQKKHESKIQELISEINTLRENMKANNKIIDNAPPLSNCTLTPLSSLNDKNLENKMPTTETERETEKGEYLTSVSFFICNSVDLCIAQLNYYGFEEIEGDIRRGAGGHFCVLGCKHDKNQPPITNIIGSVSDKEEPVIIYENGIKYTAVKDPLNNSDIHRGSGGNFLCLYYTNEPKAGKPIKNLKTMSTKEILTLPNIVKYCMRSTKFNKPFEPLDCNRGRGSIINQTPQNYIFIERD